MSSISEIATKAFELLKVTVVREHMTLEQAIQMQYELVDSIQSVMGSDIYLTEDYGQVRQLATVGFGGGGRPWATARTEKALALFFGVEEAVLVHGAGTGSIRAAVNTGIPAGGSVVLHSAHPYKTTLPIMEQMGLKLHQVDFNDARLTMETIKLTKPDGVYIQHVPQALGDNHEITNIISLSRKISPNSKIIVDDNYAVMRTRKIGVQLGADLSAFSLFKLLSPTPIGCVLGSESDISKIRQSYASAGTQVQGPAAMQALRMLVFAPVALALQNSTVLDVSHQINQKVGKGDFPLILGAVAAQPGIRCSVLVFNKPVAEAFVRSAWRNGSPSQSVGEEAQPEVIPLFTYLTSTFLKGMPGLEKYAIRINPMRGGSDTILKIITAAFADKEFTKEVSEIERTS